ncbi:MAG: triose-phosphate isomerase [Enterococcus sp.]|uniref:triose-phosphate isomerase n=1 Tax=Enterococcus sp. TaxID=35783 RepID=UPI0039937334
MKKIQTPFFCVNPKGYLFGSDLLELAKVADELSKRYQLTIFFTVPFTEAYPIIRNTENWCCRSAHGWYFQRERYDVFSRVVSFSRFKATFLNHAEHPMTYHELEQAVRRAKESELYTIVCANSVTEGKAVALLEPSIIVCEPTDLIGTGKTSDSSYMKECNLTIKEISRKTKVLQAAGISTAEDVKKALESGADGTGGTSGIVCSDSPKETLTELIQYVAKYKER